MLGLATRYGARKSPVFVGDTGGYANVVSYTAPHWLDTEGLLRGLRAFFARTAVAAPVLRFERARVAVKNHLEGPNPDVDRIIRSVKDNGWRLSNKLAAEFPQLSNPVLAGKVVSAVRDALAGQTGRRASAKGNNCPASGCVFIPSSK